MNKTISAGNNNPLSPFFLPYKDNLPECIIVDIDWTLAFMDWKRSPYDYSKVDGDRFNDMLYKLITRLNPCVEVFIVSWRSEDCRKETEEWLAKNNILYDASWLYMRKSGDNRCDTIIKEEIYREYIENKFNVLAIFEDRNRVVKMWRDLWLPCFQVFDWDF